MTAAERTMDKRREVTDRRNQQRKLHKDTVTRTVHSTRSIYWFFTLWEFLDKETLFVDYNNLTYHYSQLFCSQVSEFHSITVTKNFNQKQLEEEEFTCLLFPGQWVTEGSFSVSSSKTWSRDYWGMPCAGLTMAEITEERCVLAQPWLIPSWLPYTHRTLGGNGVA